MTRNSGTPVPDRDQIIQNLLARRAAVRAAIAAGTYQNQDQDEI